METEPTEIHKKRRRFFLLGPPAVLISFSQVLTVTVLTDLIVYRTCLFSLRVNTTECLLLRNNASSNEAVNLEMEVEPYASVIVMANFLIKSILPAVICLFLGPWSDRGGRKPLLMAATSGLALMFVTLALMCNWNMSPWYLLVASIPANMVGGMFAAKLALVCYISDTTKNKSRIAQLSLLEASICCGNVLGGFVGPLIYKNYGYSSIFSTAAICCTMAVLYTHFFIPETVKNTSKESIRGLFKLSFVKELIASTTVKREGLNRLIVWLAIVALTSNVLVYRGDMTIKFLFTRARLGWDVQQYSYFDAADAVLRITGLCGVSLRSRVSGASDTLIAIVSFSSALCGAVIKSLAWKSWHMYLSMCMGMFSGVTCPVMRTITSKFVPAEDVGKVFSLLALLEILSTCGGTPLYTLIYSNYLPPVYPSPVFLLSVGFFAISIICVSGITVLIRNKNAQLCAYAPAAQENPQS